MGKIKVQKNVGGIEGLCVIEPKVFGDSRGYFVETYNKNDMLEEGLDLEFAGQSIFFIERSSPRIAFSETVSTGKTCACHQRTRV